MSDLPHARSGPRRRGLAPKTLLSICVIGIVVLGIVYLATSMGQGKVTRAVSPAPDAGTSVSRISPQATPPPLTPPPAPKPAPSPPVDEADLEPAQVRLIPEFYDFGVMDPGSVNVRNVQLRNISSEPIRVTGTKKTCSCTTVDMTPGVLQPGEEMPIRAMMTAGLTPADKNTVKVVVQYEGYAPTTINIRGLISHAVQVLPRDIRVHSSGYDKPGYRTIGVINLRSLDQRPFRVTGSGGKPPVFVSPDSTSEVAALGHAVRWDISEYDRETGLNASGERVPYSWLIETDHPDSPVVEVPLNHMVNRLQPRGNRPWFFIDRRTIIDPIDAGGFTEFELPVSWSLGTKGTEAIYSVDSESPDFTSELIEITPNPDGKATNLRIRITPAEGVTGPIMGTIQVKSTKYSSPFTVVGFVRPGTS